MRAFPVHDVERKTIAILEALESVSEPLGSTTISRLLRDSGVELSDRTVRYHLKLLDERGLTTPFGKDGRLITSRGREELRNALVGEKIGLVVAKIEQLAYQTTFDWRTCSGALPVNVSFFPRDRFSRCLRLMRPVFAAGLCVSQKVCVAEEGERLIGVVVPPGRIGMATACSILTNGCLLKAGIPMDSKFGGIIQVRDGKPLRFVDLIHYDGSSLDPSEAFIRARMTDVRGVVRDGNGKLLANFREIPSPAKPIAREVIDGLRECGFNSAMVVGEANDPVCEVPVGPNRVGIILLGGLLPVAAVHEDGVDVASHAMSGMMDASEMESFEEVYERFTASGS